MNIAALGSVVASIVVFIISIYLSLNGFDGFYDRNSVIIVVGGTICAVGICIPFKDLMGSVKATKQWAFENKQVAQLKLIEEILTLAKAKKQGEIAYNQAAKNVSDPFLKDAASILFWSDAEVTIDEFRDLLETRSDTFFSANLEYAKTYKLMTKFPPAFGMMGTVLGLIALLKGLGGEGAKEKIGPAMAVALVTTLYGIMINNLLLIPVGESMERNTKKDIVNHQIVIEGLMLIQQRKPTKYIEEKLMSFLLPEDRVLNKKVA